MGCRGGLNLLRTHEFLFTMELENKAVALASLLNQSGFWDRKQAVTTVSVPGAGP